MIHIFFMICHRKFHVFHKAFLVGHVINQGIKNYSGSHACLTKENVTEMLRASRCHHLCLWIKYHAYFNWHYINVDEVSCITLKKLLQSAMDLLQTATGITKCDDYYKLRQYSIRLHEDTVKQPLRTEKSQDNKIMS